MTQDTKELSKKAKFIVLGFFFYVFLLPLIILGYYITMGFLIDKINLIGTLFYNNAFILFLVYIPMLSIVLTVMMYYIFQARYIFYSEKKEYKESREYLKNSHIKGIYNYMSIFAFIKK
ncbi:hypothetical protein H9M94_02895 [Mycoplasma sp. Pen4]|uniref:hypothetical protein n=1 Tax=Mycoplasma sp. Pen4 TaxID=640330 RepID=UPI001654BE0A|nr:hypothetical protein [Mycoplasma sp. Pen4]QNM93534.1 hypothetical protein H9M94_02895 [Mycoplasma sp. Pen4]